MYRLLQSNTEKGQVAKLNSTHPHQMYDKYNQQRPFSSVSLGMLCNGKRGGLVS